MEELRTKIRQNLARSYQSIRYNWKQYLSFFIAVFLMQCFFWMLMLTHDAQKAQIEYNAAKNYDYHIAVSGLTQDQSILLQNSAFTVFLDDRVYEIVRVEPQTDAYGSRTETVYLLLAGDHPEKRVSSFTRRYLNPILEDAPNASTIGIYHSPRLTRADDVRALIPTYAICVALFALTAVLVLMLLYNIRINHYKFQYGIYMSFGADFKKLLYTAAWELITVSLLTLGPALLTAAVLRILLALTLGGRFAVSWATIPLVFFLNLAVIFAAVWLPMRLLSRKSPMTLLAAQDNTNLVTSPRRSFPLFGRRFPDAYEGASIWRYRRYYIRLLLSSVIFASLSISLLYVGTMYRKHAEQPPVPYSVSAKALAFSLPDELHALDGTLYLNYTYQDNALSDQQDHLLIPTRAIRHVQRFFLRSEVQGTAAEASVIQGYHATNNAAYYPLNQTTIASLEAQAAYDGSITIEGDLYAALTQPNTVVLGDSIYNMQMLNIKPGDTVRLALFDRAARKIDPNLTSNREILRQQLRYYDFTYIECTVGAVIHGMPAGRNLFFGVSVENYAAWTGAQPTLTRLEVAADPTLDADGRAAHDAGFNAVMRYYNGYSVERSSDFDDAALAKTVGILPMLRIAAVMVLIFFPLVCFFSQILFYYKRSRELLILLSIGGTNAEVRRLHRLDGALVAGVSFLLTLGLSYLLNYTVYYLCNYLLPSYALLDFSVRYVFTISPAMLLTALIVSLGCGYLSCILPYHQFRNRQKKHDATAEVLSDDC